MELLFVDRSLEELCASRARLDERFGAPFARALSARLHELEAALTPAELRMLPHLRVRAPVALPGVVHLDVVHPSYLAVGRERPSSTTASASIDWKATDPVIVIEIAHAPVVEPPERRER